MIYLKENDYIYIHTGIYKYNFGKIIIFSKKKKKVLLFFVVKNNFHFVLVPISNISLINVHIFKCGKIKKKLKKRYFN